MSKDTIDRISLLVTINLLAVIALLFVADVHGDCTEGASGAHLVVKTITLPAAVGGVILLANGHLGTRSELTEARTESRQWRSENQIASQNLGTAIEKQMRAWKLSVAESAIGLLLLKGFSHKEIAAMRNTSERTVREQARTLYRKSGLSGRSALSAFFLEDLLVSPRDEA